MNRAYAIVLSVIIAGVFGSVIYMALTGDQIEDRGKDQELTGNSIPVETPYNPPKNATPLSSFSQSKEGIQCENCHMNPTREYVPQAISVRGHVEGGKYCNNCHGSKVHDIHIGQGTINLDCKTCHGIPPTIPKAEEGHVVCENCHGYPNPLEPSYGNLVDIHLSRGIYCINCHTEGFLNIHLKKEYG
jgi:hypothetical protein